jgi:hypothetical protein
MSWSTGAVAGFRGFGGGVVGWLKFSFMVLSIIFFDRVSENLRPFIAEIDINLINNFPKNQFIS